MNPYYLPDPIYQLDGSEQQGSNCWAAVGAWQLDGKTGGKMRVTPTRIRTLSGNATGGGSLWDIQAAFSKLGFTYRVATLRAADVRLMLSTQSRKLVSIPTAYDLWPAEQKCDSPGFDGFHMVGVRPGLLPDREVLVMNPLCSKPGPSTEARFQKVSLAAVMKAAQACSSQVGVAGGYVLAGITQVPRPDPTLPEDTVDRLERQLSAAIAHITEQRDDSTAFLTGLASEE